ncbi:oligopeptide transporter [Metarhizium guizhouense ARSEF 977]|uniref:Oligopeptide transporter n=1 Tax=Metarhizium guizhouense (strain ARSEF 977) TaxID=1276136 RepID=A0A0B4GYQ6_METGA|nr:oligopeptide transporter [Metarhizium guizhouense ARSEF 977]
MPTGDNLAEPVVGAQLRAEATDEKRASLQAVQKHEAAVQNSVVAPGDTQELDETSVLPTTEELALLRRVPNHIPLKLFTIAFIELCERFSYYGSTVVFTNFIQQPLPPGSTTGADPTQPGALGMGQRASTGITIFNQFWQYFMPLFGAWVADAKWGRYKTISAALGVNLFGHVILILSAIPPIIVRQGASLGCLITAIIIIGFGTGGFKPNISCLIVEQLGEQRMFVRTLKSGERVIVDPAVTTERIYNWFYFFINVGALVGQLTMVYAEMHVGFYLSYTLPTIMLGFCPLVMWWGRRRYLRREPAGSVLVPALRTFMLAQRGRWSINPFQTHRNLHDGTFWDSVKPSRFSPDTRPAWMTFDDAWVDELRRGFAACAAAVLQRNGIPNDVLSNLNPFALLIFIPLNDFFIYPALRKAGIRFTPIRKITAGFFVGCAAMVWAAVVQHYIYQTSVCGSHASGTTLNEAGETVKCPAVEINVWAQTGSYVLIALAEVFASITSLEYAYSKAPKNMRSMVQAVALFMTSFAAAIGQAFVSLASDPLLVWNYAIVAILAFVAGTCFYFQFRNLDVHEDELNELPEGQVGKVDAEAPFAFKDEKS